MSTRKTPLENGEFYHIYNRGVDKRNIFSDVDDMQRFFQSMIEFNVVDPIGSLYENSFRLGGSTAKLAVAGPREREEERLVNFVCYCVNPNHYHFILEQVTDGGISEFMKRLSGGYTWYFNNKNKRNGVLFQGKFKSLHIDSNEYLLHLSAYVNLNDRVHKLHKLRLGGSTAKSGKYAKRVQSRSSWDEYKGEIKGGLCSKNIILEQFKNKREYQKFAQSALESILERKEDMKEVEKYLLE